MLYAAGSLLFVLALLAALAVIAMSFARHGAQMVAALRTLSLDAVHEPGRGAAVPPMARAGSAALAIKPLPVRRLAA